MQHTNKRYKDLTKRIEEEKHKDGYETQKGPHPVLVTPDTLCDECKEFSQKYGLGPGYVGVVMNKLDAFKSLDAIDAGELIHAMWLGFKAANSAKYVHNLSTELIRLADACRTVAESKKPEYIRHQRASIVAAIEQFADPKKCIETIINAVSSTHNQ